MKRLLRPAFIVTATIAAGCAGTQSPTPQPEKTPEEAEAFRKKYGVHPRDADLHLIFAKGDGTCYVQVDKDEPPPKDLMSGEMWVEDKPIACPKEFDDPAFASLSQGKYWALDETTGVCSIEQNYGNPPPAGITVPCPPILQQYVKPGVKAPEIAPPDPPAPSPQPPNE